MQNEQADITEVSDATKPELYGLYTKWQIFITLFSSLFCMVFVGAITYSIVVTGEKNFAWLYLLPAACYVCG